jgi:hypothetical protein
VGVLEPLLEEEQAASNREPATTDIKAGLIFIGADASDGENHKLVFRAQKWPFNCSLFALERGLKDLRQQLTGPLHTPA